MQVRCNGLDVGQFPRISGVHVQEIPVVPRLRDRLVTAVSCKAPDDSEEDDVAEIIVEEVVSSNPHQILMGHRSIRYRVVEGQLPRCANRTGEHHRTANVDRSAGGVLGVEEGGLAYPDVVIGLSV